MIGHSMRKQLARVLMFGLLVIVSSSASLLAEETMETMDARLFGYPEKYWIAAPGTAGAWAVLAVLGLVCVGPLFLNSKRTHLD